MYIIKKEWENQILHLLYKKTNIYLFFVPRVWSGTYRKSIYTYSNGVLNLKKKSNFGAYSVLTRKYWAHIRYRYGYDINFLMPDNTI